MASIWDVIKKPSLTLGTPYPDASNGYGDPNANQLTAARNRITASRNRLDTSAGVLDYSNPANPQRQAVNQSDFDVYNAENSLSPLRQGLFGARSTVLEKQRASDAYGRTMLDSSRNDILASDAERRSIEDASHDVGDLTALAEEAQYRGATDKRLARIGVSAPIEISTPRGFAGGLPGGVREALRSKADYLTEDARSASAGRQTRAALDDIEAKRLGFDVTDASRGVTAADLALDQAGESVTAAKSKGTLARLLLNQGLDSAKYADGMAGLDSTRAGLDVTESQLPPQPGMVEYMDPATHTTRWVYPDERDNLEYDYKQQQDLERLPRTQQIAIQRKQQQTKIDNAQSPLAGADDTDFARILYADESKWADVLSEIKRRSPGIDDTVARIKVQQLLDAARAQKERERKAAETAAGGSGPKIDRPAFN